MVGEVEKSVFNLIDKNESFIIEAGAGSGKTWTLIQSLLYIINRKGQRLKKENQRIACITYTNVAKDEIIKRIQGNSLVTVSTIHDFLWSNIKSFQKEIKEELINYIGERLDKKRGEISALKSTTTKKYAVLDETIERYEEALNELRSYHGIIAYKDRRSWRKGVISHDEILHIASSLVKKYSALTKIIQDTYPIIFVDEYQDTNSKVIDLLLEYLKPRTSILFGFFGDYMQQIYDDSIGKIDEEKYGLQVIVKKQNYRSSQEVISVLNRIRSDIQQEQTGKTTTGKCLFYYLNDLETDAEKFIQQVVANDLAVEESNIKKLYLTTKSIAIKNGYLELHSLYDGTEGKNKDQILKNKDNRECPFANFLLDVEEIVELYAQLKIQNVLQKISFKINCFRDKITLKKNLEDLDKKTKNESIREIMTFVDEKEIKAIPDALKAYFNKPELQDDFFKHLMDLKYIQVKNLYYTVKETSLFSTNHGTKGAEYDNVACVINDKDWVKYNVNKYLDKTDYGTDRYERTKKLFYVICSRAKHNLAIIVLSELSTDATKEAKTIFGEECFIYNTSS